MKRLALLTLLLLAIPLAASADVVANIDIPDTVVCNDNRQPGNPPAGACDFDIGSATTVVVASITIDPVWIGAACDVTHRGANGPSVHPGTNLIVRSENSVVAADVERAPGVSTDAVGTLIINDTGTVSVVVELGPDGVWSGNGNTILDCTEATSSSTSTTTTVTSSTTTPPATSTSLPSSSTTTTENTSTTNPPAPIPPATSPPSTQIPPVSSPPTLPFTGPEDVAPLLMAVVALFALGGGLLVAAKAGRHEG